MNIRNRAELSIAQGALTNSKRPETFIAGVYPTHSDQANGALIFADGKRYIDYVTGLGTNLLGYGHPLIAQAIHAQYLRGSTISLSTEIEVQLAEKLQGLFPCGERWKFLKNGSDACFASLRMARAFTGRDLVLSEGYHGIADDFVSLTPPALGVPRRDWIKSFNWDDVPRAAAVIIEPVVTDHSRERRDWLQRLRDACTKHGTVLIFDEIITGFRTPKYSFANMWGIHPDIILLGKAMGGGLPLSAIGGKKEILNQEYFVSGTFFGETCSMAASLKLIEIVHKDGSKFSMQELWDKGQAFTDKFNELHPRLKITGYPSRGVFEGDDAVKALFWQEACKAGILFGPSWFFNFPLISFTDMVISTSKDILKKIELGFVRLEGKPPRKPYAQALREQYEASPN